MDLNPDRNQFQRKYAGQIKRLNELQRILVCYAEGGGGVLREG